MDPFLIDHISRSNCFRVDGNVSLKIRPNQKTVLYAVAMSSVCSIDLSSKVGVAELKKESGREEYGWSGYTSHPSVCDVINLFENKARYYTGSRGAFEAHESTLDKIAMLCGFSYRRVIDIVHGLKEMGVLFVGGDGGYHIIPQKLIRDRSMDRGKFK